MAPLACMAAGHGTAVIDQSCSSCWGICPVFIYGRRCSRDAVFARAARCTAQLRRTLPRLAFGARGGDSPGLTHSPLVTPVDVPREARQIRVYRGIIDATGVQHELDVTALPLSWN